MCWRIVTLPMKLDSIVGHGASFLIYQHELVTIHGTRSPDEESWAAAPTPRPSPRSGQHLRAATKIEGRKIGLHVRGVSGSLQWHADV